MEESVSFQHLPLVTLVFPGPSLAFRCFGLAPDAMAAEKMEKIVMYG